MKKIWTVAMTMILLVLCAVPSSAAFLPPIIVLDGVEQSYPVPPLLDEGTVLVPMRLLWESLGAVVTWDEENRTVRAVKDETTIELSIGSPYARVNGALTSMAKSPLIIGSVTMVPLRFVGESMGARVEWLAENRQVQICTGIEDNEEQEVSDSEQDVPTPGKVFTFEDAVALAQKNSTELSNARKSVVQAEERREQLANLRQIGYTPVGPGFTDADAADRDLLLRFIQADMGWQMARRQVEMLEESIALQVRNTYNEVLKNESELTMATFTVQNEEKKLAQARLKAEQGLISAVALQNAEKAYHGEKIKKESIENQLEEAYIILKRLLRLDEIDSLEAPPIPDTVFDIDLEHHIRRVLHDNPHIWLQKQNIWLAEMELSLYTYNVGAQPYRVKEIDVSKEKNNLAILKRDTEDTARSLYYQLKEMENQLQRMETNLSQAENALNQAGIYYTLGMATAADVLAAELAVAQLEHQMQTIKLSYGQLYMLFEKPWLRS